MSPTTGLSPLQRHLPPDLPLPLRRQATAAGPATTALSGGRVGHLLGHQFFSYVLSHRVLNDPAAMRAVGQLSVRLLGRGGPDTPQVLAWFQQHLPGWIALICHDQRGAFVAALASASAGGPLASCATFA